MALSVDLPTKIKNMPTLAIELSQLPIVLETARLKAEVDALRPLSPELEGRIMQKFRLEWNYHSNSIEGNSLNYGETVAFLMHGLTAKGKPFKDHLDIRGHNEAILFLTSIVKETRGFTESDIRALHKMILVEPYLSNAITPDGQPTQRLIKLGEYKTTPNSVKTKTGEMHYYTSPEDVPIKMSELMTWYNSLKINDLVDPSVIAAIFHYRFVAIHPFDDGNGRTARILMNLILMQAGYPPIIIPTENRLAYYGVLAQADAGDYVPLVEYLSELLQKSLNVYIKASRGESIEDLSDVDKKIELFVKGFEDKSDMKTKNNDDIEVLINQSFIPLFKLLDSKMDNFSALFFDIKKEITREYEVGNDLSEIYDFTIINSNDLTINSLKGEVYSQALDFEYCYSLKGFKNKEDNFNIDAFIYVKFKPYKYQIIDDSRKKSITKYYNEQLTESEMVELVKSCVDNVMNEIKEKTQKG